MDITLVSIHTCDECNLFKVHAGPMVLEICQTLPEATFIARSCNEPYARMFRTFQVAPIFNLIKVTPDNYHDFLINGEHAQLN